MSDSDNVNAIIELNRIILDAQRIIQRGGTMREVWNALYVPTEIRYVFPEQLRTEDRE